MSLKKLQLKMKTLLNRIAIKQITVREALCNQRGSQTVEYLLLAAAGVVLIVVVGMPAMKTLFNVDIMTALKDKVKSIWDFT